MANENGGNAPQPIPINFDLSDDQQFKLFVVQQLQLLADRTAPIADMRVKVNRHDTYFRVAKWLGIPTYAILHGTLRHYLTKWGW